MNNLIFDRKLIAPCGINCGVCIAYLRTKNKCCGCNERFENKPKHCINCRIAKCDHLAKTESKLCYECEKFPCTRMKQLDARYRKNYSASLIQNLKDIQISGIESFLKTEAMKWICPSCNRVTSMHKYRCIHCGAPITKEKSKDDKKPI